MTDIEDSRVEASDVPESPASAIPPEPTAAEEAEVETVHPFSKEESLLTAGNRARLTMSRMHEALEQVRQSPPD